MDLFDRRLRINGAGFYYRYTNLQVTRINPLGGANLVDSAGSAAIWGSGSLDRRHHRAGFPPGRAGGMARPGI
ncbi:hypothetical protein [Sphingobium chlorophenolicum]|uniref:hypothetical protein n=1 Tax=Sphingobium chlorophenolicum TaxID=46429 RepID=UPI0020B8B3C0